MHILELENMQEHSYLDRFGNLTSSGKHHFWYELMCSFQHIDNNSGDGKDNKDNREDIQKETISHKSSSTALTPQINRHIDHHPQF